MGYKWRPIEDLPPDYPSMADPELESLARHWSEHQQSLKATGRLAEVQQRIQREWAIETGIIEDVYRIDRGITNTLIERGIRADYIARDSTGKSPELIARIILDHAEALEALYEFVSRKRRFTTGYIKELHAAMLRNQATHTVFDPFGNAFEKDLQKGEYKTSPNNPLRPDGEVHEYCPPIHVAAEMDRMAGLHEEHTGKHVPAVVEAAWLHHVFSQIHPFEDGNGRVARALATVVFLQAGLFPLIITREDRVSYIDALEAADHRDLRPLTMLFARAQRECAGRVIH
jgi:Fic family protein